LGENQKKSKSEKMSLKSIDNKWSGDDVEENVSNNSSKLIKISNIFKSRKVYADLEINRKINQNSRKRKRQLVSDSDSE